MWRCVTRLTKLETACTARTISEDDLQWAVITAINDAWAQKNRVIPILKDSINETLDGDGAERLRAVDEKMKELQEALLKAGHDSEKIEELRNNILKLREERQSILMKSAKSNEQMEKVNAVIDFLDSQTEAVTEYSEILVRRLIEKITIYDEKVTVEFKSGFTVDVDA